MISTYYGILNYLLMPFRFVLVRDILRTLKAAQLASLTSKISRGIGILRYSERYVPASTIKLMCKSLVELNFRYCCPVWGNVGGTSLTYLQKLQNRAARIVTGSRHDKSALLLIRALGGPRLGSYLILKHSKWFPNP